MLKDLRDLKGKEGDQVMRSGHRKRFLDRLDQEFPSQNTKLESKGSFPRNFKKNWAWAAAIALIFSLGYMSNGLEVAEQDGKQVVKASLADFSPRLGDIEKYYLGSIQYELATLDSDSMDSEFVKGYFDKIEELNKEYDILSQELYETGLNEANVNALIENLQLRLDLLKDLKTTLNENN